MPRSWHEGAVALGLNPLRATLAVSLRAIRPAIIAATALATARAIGEAIVIDMVSGGNAFTPKPQDGLIFIFEPLRTLASEIIDQAENLSAPAVRSSIYAIALLLMFSGFMLSVASRLIAPAAAQLRAEQLMASAEPLTPPRCAAPPRRRGRRSSLRSWRRGDQLVFVLAWLAGTRPVPGRRRDRRLPRRSRGSRYLRPEPARHRARARPSTSRSSGGFLDPMIGTLTLAVIGTLIATPIAVATAVWIVEYGRPRWLAGDRRDRRSR